ncbi:hypothetical protein D3C71_24020 [compost metagenome]
MRPDILAYVRELSKQDKKTLGQKTLKLSEETGEASKAVLAYESAQGTSHRFVTPRKILEEIADGMLVGLSMVYDLGYTDDDLAEMMKAKADYWAELQAREELLQSRSVRGTPYEIHVTVKEAANLDSFKQACAVLQVKPIVLDLQTRQSGVIKDVMTSSVFFGRSNTEAYGELERVAGGLARAGFEVVRRKIETVPWHPAAPSERHAKPVMPPDAYFECHFNVRLENDERRAVLQGFAEANGCHLSRNAFKRFDDGSSTVMMTMRQYDGTQEQVQEHVSSLAASLRHDGFIVDKEIVEFSIYDSRISHDAMWTSSSPGA